ncbi:hypothetical protein [Herbiconiux ginsengi]|uniref:PHP domain-containing protein n=1 Tax=Herbiconiux ginsengi TaxID=381665 RepID=A0A1H3U364_9MICO|nr:hypothetical protein [Herbiconiux ginsengi]SDZ56737.1 hypothetical protein SAMN05216554_0077 [Herbiconiux ginsengi]
MIEPQPLYNPYAGLHDEPGAWQKAQFHLHHLIPDKEGGSSVESAEPLAEIFREYRSADYQIAAQSSYATWLDTAELGDEIGIQTYNGQEYVEYDGILLIGTRRLHVGTPQSVIDGCLDDGGFAVICHPNQNPELSEANPAIPRLLTREMSEALTGAVGVEVYNGCLPHREWNGIGFGSGLATDYWDDALTSGRLLWGFATDDSHDRHEINQGWTDIHAASTGFADVRRAVYRGRLTASRGLRLYDFDLDDSGLLTVEADLPYSREFHTDYTFVGSGGRTLHRAQGQRATFHVGPDESYVRVEARSGDGSMLWTQPVVRAEDFGLTSDGPAVPTS